MTKRERAQVVELLRCAADLAASEQYIDDAFDLYSGAAYGLAVSAWVHVICEGERGAGFGCALLEAAARVEEGSWP